jgi:hypothetical protein
VEPKQGPTTGEIIDRLYSASAETPSPPAGTVLTWYGQFSDELPEPFCLKQGGHGWLLARDTGHTGELVNALRSWVLAYQAKPAPNLDLGITATKEWAGADWYRWMLADGRQMTVQIRRLSRLTPAQKKLLKDAP